MKGGEKNMIDNELIIVEGSREIPVYTGHVPGINPEDRVTPPGYVSIFDTGEATVLERPQATYIASQKGNIANIGEELAQIAEKTAANARPDA